MVRQDFVGHLHFSSIDKFFIVVAYFFVISGFLLYLPTQRVEIPLLTTLVGDFCIGSVVINFVFGVEDRILEAIDNLDNRPEALRNGED